MHAQIDRLAYAHTSFFTSEPAEALADHLTSRAPEGLEHVYLVSGGSEAVETALKMARQYFVEIGETDRSLFVARRQSYHGNTLGALAVGGNARRRAMFAPLLVDARHVSPCYAYREQRGDESPEDTGCASRRSWTTRSARAASDASSPSWRRRSAAPRRAR